MKQIIDFLKNNWLIFIPLGLGIWLFLEIRKKGIVGLVGNLIGGTSDVVAPVPKRAGLISDDKAKGLADRMYNAFNYFFGTDDKDLDYVYEEIVKIPGSIVDVFSAFGTRKYAISGTGLFASLGIGSDLNLRGWLREELSESEFKKWDSLLMSYGL